MKKSKGGRITLAELFEKYRLRKLLSAAANTVGKYERSIRACRDVLGREPLASDLSDELVAQVMQRKLEKGRATYTVNSDRAKLVALWTWGARRGLVDTFPDIDRLRESESAPVAWLRDELPLVIAACDHAKRAIGGVPGPLWFRALLFTLWDTGERIGAILATEYSALAGNTLTVAAALRKGKTRDMVYELHGDTATLLREMRRYSSDDKLFPRDCCYETVGNRWRSCLKRAGLPHDRKHLFHCVRRSVASHARNAGGDATALLDHSDGSITKRFYIDPRVAKPVSPADVLFRPTALAGKDGPDHAA